MALFVIADLHLDIKSNEKSMEVFGRPWQNYTERIASNWKKLVSEEDTVIIPGDISWGLTTEDAAEDLKWIDALPGKKIVMKGNHDFWWSTVSKMERFFCEKSINSIDILNNNAIEVENYILAGSRGWFVDKSMQTTELHVDYSKIVNRETIRLRMSLEEAARLQKQTGKEILVFFHFPPLWSDYACEPLLNLLLEYGVRRCFFGHIHGCYTQPPQFEWNGIQFRMISADFLNFIPHRIG